MNVYLYQIKILIIMSIIIWWLTLYLLNLWYIYANLFFIILFHISNIKEISYEYKIKSKVIKEENNELLNSITFFTTLFNNFLCLLKNASKRDIILKKLKILQVLIIRLSHMKYIILLNICLSKVTTHLYFFINCF